MTREKLSLTAGALKHTATALIMVALGSYAAPAVGGELVEPRAFASHNGLLDLLIVAKPKPVESITFSSQGGKLVHPMGWVYEICPRPPIGEECAQAAPTYSDYGGARLALRQGDTLKVHFVNRLPSLDPQKLAHARDRGGENLPFNPTNLHTHGLIVPARGPSSSDPTFGDYVFVDVFNPANGKPATEGAHHHSIVAMGSVDYRIDIPRNHPSGLFWFHPHVHGIALNQLSSGLAGVITIGDVGDYARKADGTPFSAAETRHLILKDMQALAVGSVQFENGPAMVSDGEVLNQQDPDFCRQLPERGETRQGSCPGADNTPEGGNNFAGGKWYFTVNGQVFPTVPLKSEQGEVWRLTNASGSVSYHLQLVDDTTQKQLVMQLIAVDGVSINLPQGATADEVVRVAGAKFKVAACPEVSSKIGPLPVCVTDLVMMPSSRAELWVTYRDPTGRIIAPRAGSSATLKTVGLTMGSGDAWPAVDLAKVQFLQTPSSAPLPPVVTLTGDALKMSQAGGIFSAPAPGVSPASLPPGCRALPAGHHRRIFFGLENLAEDDSFGLGYEEVDEHGQPVAGTKLPVARFDPHRPNICLPLGRGQTPVHETWELVQLSTEHHNFHVHQTKFRQMEASAPSNSPLALKLNAAGFGIAQDNIPLGVATPKGSIRKQVIENQSGVCSVEQWRSGDCASQPILLDVPFAKVGDFVYHCHILEHEDGGMMAKIRVVPSPD